MRNRISAATIALAILAQCSLAGHRKGDASPFTEPYLGEEEIRAMGDPDFKFIETLKLRPRVKTAPEIDRFNIRQDGDSTAVANESMSKRK